jgi:hypothetical protein
VRPSIKKGAFASVVVGHVSGNDPPEMTLVQSDHMIKAVAP